MGMFKLRLDITPKGFEKVSEMAERVKDFSVAFVNIIEEWADDNERRKFAKGAGAEKSGVDQAPARWQPLTKEYYKQKHNILSKNAGYFPDWLMVRTGDLREALSRRGGFAEYVAARRVVFGTPNDPENAAKVAGNKEKRPTVFLDRTDRGMVRRELQRYLSLGENYKDLMFQAAGRKYALQKQSKEMDINFRETI